MSQIIYVDQKYKPKRKSKKFIPLVPKTKHVFKDLQVKVPVAYRQNDIPSLNSHSFKGTAGRIDPNVYSGERKLLGIGVLHKSCLQPIFNEQDAVDIAHMRR